MLWWPGGSQVVVICPGDPGRPLYEAIDGVQVYRYPAPPAAGSFLGYVWEYGYTLTATFEPDPQLRHGKPFVLGYSGTIGFQDGVDSLCGPFSIL